MIEEQQIYTTKFVLTCNGCADQLAGTETHGVAGVLTLADRAGWDWTTAGREDRALLRQVQG